LATCRKFGSTARNYAAARLMTEVGLRVNETRHLDLTEIKWDLGGSGNSMSGMAKVPAVPGPAGAWCR
jgi:integrase/recombinase XerD